MEVRKPCFAAYGDGKLYNLVVTWDNNELPKDPSTTIPVRKVLAVELYTLDCSMQFCSYFLIFKRRGPGQIKKLHGILPERTCQISTITHLLTSTRHSLPIQEEEKTALRSLRSQFR